jgi:acetyl-CoA acetyltransferase
MGDAWVVGIGMTRFAKHEDTTPEALVKIAVAEALHDCGLDPADIDAVVVGSAFAGPGNGQRLFRDSSFVGHPLVNVENACASSTSALLEAVAWVGSGLARTVLVVGVEMLTGKVQGLLPVAADDPYGAQGLTLPALYALKARYHMERFGTRPEQFALVAVKNRRHAVDNPRARYQSPVSLDEVLGSRPIAEPLTLLQCCPNSDGASAAVVAATPIGKARAVKVTGSALGSGLRRAEIGWDEPTLRRVAARAYERAGIGPSQVDVVEVHDAFTPGEVLAYERLGFSEEGKGGFDLEGGRFHRGGPGPVVNPGGGLLARGHPPGATGLAQVHEIVTQLRGEAGARQADGAGIGVTVTMGGNVPQLETNACVVHVFAAS